MSRSILGHFDGRVIVPDEPLPLVAGQRLRVEVEAIDEEKSRFADLLGLAADLPEAPPDLSSQHDHYLYGTPKQ